MSAYNNFPAFSPYNFEIRTQAYGNSGGNCMVGTVEFYLPDAETSVWVNCSREAVSVYAANIIWNEDGNGSSEDTEDYLLFQAGLTNDIPYTVKPWLSMIKEALAYTIEREMSHSDICTNAFSLPVDWLPDSIKERVEPAYLDWLKKLGKEIHIGKGGVIVADDEYVGCVTHEVKPVDEQPEYDESEPTGDDVYMFRLLYTYLLGGAGKNGAMVAEVWCRRKVKAWCPTTFKQKNIKLMRHGVLWTMLVLTWSTLKNLFIKIILSPNN